MNTFLQNSEANSRRSPQIEIHIRLISGLIGTVDSIFITISVSYNTIPDKNIYKHERYRNSLRIRSRPKIIVQPTAKVVIQ